MTAPLALTWWGHSSATVELDGVRIATDPLLADRLAHLRRSIPEPPPDALLADVVLISHLHSDHLHVPSLRRFSPDVPILAPPGARAVVGDVTAGRIREVRPGDHIDLDGLDIEVLQSFHDGRRNPLSHDDAPALGFRVTGPTQSLWYPGDTGLTMAMHDVAPVDLALVPIGGWGPSLGDRHMGPAQAAEAVRRVGARLTVPVHYGTYWPIGLRRLSPGTYRRLFIAPPRKFVTEIGRQHVPTEVRVLRHGERVTFPKAEDVS